MAVVAALVGTGGVAHAATSEGTGDQLTAAEQSGTGASLESQNSREQRDSEQELISDEQSRTSLSEESDDDERMIAPSSASTALDSAPDLELDVVNFCDNDSGPYFPAVKFDEESGAVTVDLGAAHDKWGGESLFIGTGSNQWGGQECVSKITSVTFVGEGYDELIIGDNAFYQRVGDYGLPSGSPVRLKSVTFPETGLKRLITGHWSFAQAIYEAGNTSLKSVVFPKSLEVLDIGHGSFDQYVEGNGQVALSEIVWPEHVDELSIREAAFRLTGESSLENVVLPEGPTSLVIGELAFSQGEPAFESKASLKEVKFPSTLKSLEIGTHAFQQVDDPVLTQVEFPEGLEDLTIGTEAFYQGGSSTALSKISFPESLRNLTLDDFAFFQQGQAALTDVTFPRQMDDLTIGCGAFRQEVDFFGGDKYALKTVTFPRTLNNLSVGAGAFSQGTDFPGNGSDLVCNEPAVSKPIQYPVVPSTLKSIVFPEEVSSLDVGFQAFAVVDDDGEITTGRTDKLMLFFPFSESNKPADVQVATPVTTYQRLPEGNAVWVWLGEDGTTTKAAWQNEGKGDFALRGTYTATFSANGGSLPQGLASEWSVFPETEGQIQAQPVANATALNPVGFFGENPAFKLDLPQAEPTRPGYAFTGWSPVLQTRETAKVLKPGAQFQMNSNVEFVAQWTKDAPGEESSSTETPEKPAVSTEKASALAKTGASSLPFLTLGAIFLAGGLALLAAKRRS